MKGKEYKHEKESQRAFEYVNWANVDPAKNKPQLKKQLFLWLSCSYIEPLLADAVLCVVSRWVLFFAEDMRN